MGGAGLGAEVADPVAAEGAAEDAGGDALSFAAA
jgi:hypothetical protein